MKSLLFASLLILDAQAIHHMELSHNNIKQHQHQRSKDDPAGSTEDTELDESAIHADMDYYDIMQYSEAPDDQISQGKGKNGTLAQPANAS